MARSRIPLLLAAAAALACLGAQLQRADAALLYRPEQDCINPSVAKVNEFNFFPDDYRSTIAEAAPVAPGATVTDATDFTIEYYDTYKIVTVKRFGKKYVLYQCGTPDPSTLPAGAAKGVKPGMPSFEIPLYSVAVTDTTVNGFLSELNLVDRVALASPYSVGNCFQRLVDTKSQDGCKLVTPDPFYDTTDAAATAAFQKGNATMYEGADAVFVGFSGDASKDVLFPATADPGPLNRAEWIKYIAAFFNKEIDANAAYDSVKGTYNTLKRLVETKWVDTENPKPRVAWVTTNATGVTFRLDPYKTTLITDAGGEPHARSQLENIGGAFYSDPKYGTQGVFFARGSGGLSQALQLTDALIDETYYVGIPGLRNISRSLGYPSVGDAQAVLPAMVTGNIFRWDGEQSPTGSSGWFEMAVARPDWVLMDLARAFTPAVLQDRLNVTNNIANKGPAGTDFNFLLQVGDTQERGRPRISAAKLCSTIPSCSDRTAFAICPNAFRDCKTGRLIQADPEQRCNAWSVCDPVEFEGERKGAKGKSGAAATATRAGAALAGAAAIAAALL